MRWQMKLHGDVYCTSTCCSVLTIVRLDAAVTYMCFTLHAYGGSCARRPMMLLADAAVDVVDRLPLYPRLVGNTCNCELFCKFG